MRGAEGPTPQDIACRFNLRPVPRRNVQVDHLALVIHQRVHVDYVSRVYVLRWAHELWWLDLAQKVLLGPLRGQFNSLMMQVEFHSHGGNEPCLSRGGIQGAVDPLADGLLCRHRENGVSEQHMDVVDLSMLIDGDLDFDESLNIIGLCHEGVVRCGLRQDPCCGLLLVENNRQGIRCGVLLRAH